jgi:hypothetical protein
MDDVGVAVPVLMIDAEAGLVPPYDADTDEFGPGAAEIGLGGEADAVVHVIFPQ